MNLTSTHKFSIRDGKKILTTTTIQKLLAWIIFSLLTLFPFFLIIIKSNLTGIDVDIVALFGHGELLLISTTLCAIALSELFGVASKSLVVYLIGGISFFIILISSSLYASISLIEFKEIDVNFVVSISFVLFMVSVITSSLSILFQAKREIFNDN